MSKPIKRHQFIVEFSKDHHYGLLLVWKIRQGINKNTEQQRITGYLNFYAAKELLPHFEEEEKNLLPLLSVTDNLRKQVEAEHAQIRQQLTEINNKRTTYTLLKNIADLIEAHIRFEERIFFPYLEKSVNFENIHTSITKQNIRNRNSIDTEWKDNFWKNK